MAEPTWMTSDETLPSGFSATVGKSSVMINTSEVAAVPAPSSGTTATMASASSHGSRRATDMDTIKARSKKKVEKDLLAIVEEDTTSAVDAASVLQDVHLAAATIMKKKKETMRLVLQQIRQAQQVHLAFLVDTTGSMSPHITGVRQQIKDICNFLRANVGARGRQASSNAVSVAFVGYKDFCDGPNHFEVLPFTKDLVQFEAFVAQIVATGGGDGPEDVNGGLRKAVDALQWPGGSTNVLFHLADAPPHGSEYSSMGSSSISHQGMKADEPIAQIFGRMAQKGIDYYFGKINHSTDTMVNCFSKACGKAITPFDVNNPKNLTKCVTMASVSSVTARVRESMVIGGPSALVKKITIDKTVPVWDTLEMVKGSLVEYSFPENIEHILEYVEFETKTRKALFKVAPRPFAQGSVRFAYHAREYLPLSPGKSSVSCDSVSGTVTSSSSTSVSASDVCLREEYDADDWSVVHQVCKEFKDKGRTDLGTGTHERYRYMIGMEVQTIASFLAYTFNKLQSEAKSSSGYKICYLKSKVLAIPPSSRKGVYTYYAIERMFREDESKWVKVINNAGGVASSSDLKHQDADDIAFSDYLTAFAHWTYDVTQGYLMVTDLQGIKRASAGEKTQDTILLTDPAIHCKASTRFGRTNLGKRGMELFFESHECNEFCRAVGLKAVGASAEDEGAE